MANSSEIVRTMVNTGGAVIVKYTYKCVVHVCIYLFTIWNVSKWSPFKTPVGV